MRENCIEKFVLIFISCSKTEFAVKLPFLTMRKAESDVMSKVALHVSSYSWEQVKIEHTTYTIDECGDCLMLKVFR